MTLMHSEEKTTGSSDSTIERIKTGIHGLDEIIEGGIPKNSVTLVSGPPGGGKTIFCYQFLYEGVQQVYPIPCRGQCFITI